MNRILVVEDDARDLELLLEVLRRWPVEVLTCATAAHARELFAGRHFDAVLLNLKLGPPEPDGLDLLRWLRRQSSEVTIHVVTGAEDPRRREQAIQAGASGFFEKPYVSSDNQLLLAQLTARRAAYRRGKQMKHKRTSYAGAFTATGLALFMGPVGLSTVKFEVPSSMMTICIWLGFFMTVIGYFLGQLAAADKKVVDEHLRECEPASAPTPTPTRAQIGLSQPPV